MTFSDISLDEIAALDKSHGVVRVLLLFQIVSFVVDFAARGSKRLAYAPIEVETLAFTLCTLPMFFFWYHKVLDPEKQKTL